MSMVKMLLAMSAVSSVLVLKNPRPFIDPGKVGTVKKKDWEKRQKPRRHK